MSTISAATDAAVVLPPPRLSSELTLEQVLKKRRSAREFRDAPVPLDQLSALLWSAFGINRAGSWGRTAPSAHNRQAVSVFVVLPEGTWRYEPGEHRLVLVRRDDLRGLTGTQDFAATAPLNLVYVVDFDSEDDVHEEEHGFLAGADVGCIVENVYLYCAATGLATVVRGLIDRRPLARALGLRGTQRIALAQSIGYPLAGG